MSKEPNRIKEWRLKRRMSQSDVGKLMTPPCGKSKINKIETGAQKVKSEELIQLSRILNCEIDELLARQIIKGLQDKKTPNISIFPQDINQSLTNLYVNDQVPVYGNASAGSQGAIKLNEDYVVDQTLRHPGIANVKDSFALYVDGDSMSPRREHGELIYIHPYKPPEIGKECIIVMEPEGNVLFKRYLGKSRDGLHLLLKQFNPLEEFSIPLKSVRKIYSVVF